MNVKVCYRVKFYGCRLSTTSSHTIKSINARKIRTSLNWTTEGNRKQRERELTTWRDCFSYFSLRFESLRALVRWRLPFSPMTGCSQLEASDVGVSSNSTCSECIVLLSSCDDDESTTVRSVIGVLTGVVMIEWSLLIIMVSSFSMAAAESKSILLLFFKLFCFNHYVLINFRESNLIFEFTKSVRYSIFYR